MTQSSRQITPGDPAGYTVQPGDTLSGIAQQAYGNGSQSYWMAIYRMNQDTIGDDPNVISPGTDLWIPRVTASPQAGAVYIVQADDTPSAIAQQVYSDGSQPYSMAIYLLNQYEIGNDPNAILPGEPLYIPCITSSPDQTCFYIVKVGDTLSSIAEQAYGVSSHKELNLARTTLYGTNEKVIRNDPDQIVPGQILYVPFWNPPGVTGGGNIHDPDPGPTPCNPTWPSCHDLLTNKGI